MNYRLITGGVGGGGEARKLEGKRGRRGEAKVKKQEKGTKHKY